MNNVHDWFSLVQWTVAWVSGAVAFVMGLNKLVDKYFAHLAKKEDNRFLTLLEADRKENIDPKIDRLTDVIEGLREAVWDLKNKIQ